MELDPFVDLLEKHEKKELKFLILLFPCYYLLYYLYYLPFLDLTIFTQCMIATATTVIAQTIFRLVVFSMVILANFVGMDRMSISNFRYNILLVIVGVVWGFFGGYTLCTLYKVCGAILALLVVQQIYLFCHFWKGPVVRGKKKSPGE